MAGRQAHNLPLCCSRGVSQNYVQFHEQQLQQQLELCVKELQQTWRQKKRKIEETDQPEAKKVCKAPMQQAGGYHIKQRPPPAGVRRGGPGGWMLAQAPRKADQDGNPIGAIEYSECYVAP